MGLETKAHGGKESAGCVHLGKHWHRNIPFHLEQAI